MICLQQALASRLRDIEMFSAGIAQQIIKREEKLHRVKLHLQRGNVDKIVELLLLLLFVYSFVYCRCCLSFFSICLVFSLFVVFPFVVFLLFMNYDLMILFFFSG